MTSTNDYPGEMNPMRRISAATVEDLLAGRAVPAELESVATVVRALREVSAEPVRPSATLAAQIAAGRFTGSPVYRYQPAGGGYLVRTARWLTAAGSATARRTSLPVRLASAALAAALASVATAGFTQALPDPVQHRFERVVESVTSYHFPQRTADRGGPAGPVTGESEPEAPRNLGEEVSEDAKDGGVDGTEISEDAKDGGVDGTEISEDAKDSGVDGTEISESARTRDQPGKGNDRTRGNGNGNGNGR